LRHPPGVLALDAVIVAESIDHRRRAGRPSDCDGFQRAESEIVLLHVRKQCEPHGGYAGTVGHFLRLEQLVEALAVEACARENELFETEKVTNSAGVPTVWLA